MSVEITEIQIVHDGWGKFLIATVRLEDGQLITREIEDHGSAVGVLPYDPLRRTALLVKQFRAPMFYAIGLKQTLEVIAGGLEGNDPQECVEREALEEAGLKLRTVEHVLTGMSMPGVSTMRLDLFLASYQQGDRVGKGGGLADEREDIVVVEMPLISLAQSIDKGSLVDLT